MKGLTELVIGLCDLAEAEGRLLRYNVLKTVRTAALLILGLFFGAAGAAFFVAALYRALVEIVHPAWALCILGLACMGIAGGLVWTTSARKKSTP